MTSTPSSWPRPSEAVRELMRKGAELAQTLPPEWVERLNQALFSSPEDAKLLEDPVILAACRRANRAELLHWANANLQRPGEPVQPYVSADMVDTARELARRGLSELLMNVARSTQNTAWELWMKMAFNLTQDPRVLEEFLEVSSRSISEFIDSNMRVVTQIILEEKSAQAHDDPIDKRSLVSRLLEGRDVDTEQFGRRLGYSLFQKHYAGLVWCESPDAEIRLLEDVARTLAQLTGMAAPLIVFAGPATLWVWSHAAKPLDLNLLQGIALRFSGIRAAIGSPGTGVNGFRRSHLEALTTQRLMGRRCHHRPGEDGVADDPGRPRGQAVRLEHPGAAGDGAFGASALAARLPGQWLQCHPDRRSAGHASQHIAAPAGACPGPVARPACRSSHSDRRGP